MMRPFSEPMTEPLVAGDHVTPSVRLLRPLAQGGMGMVWIAEHLVLDTEVVVKLMAKEVEGTTGASARFAREAAVAAAVKSPHVVQVFDSGVTEGGVAFIVMELLEGRDLGAQLAASGPLAPSDVAAVIGQLGKALAKAHRVGVIHRDLKPDNIFLCELEGGERFVKLLDFGAAKDDSRAPSSTMLGQLIGTPYYMSPEQILGEPVDPRTDIWSLGVVAYEALTGAKPFEGVTVGAITLAIHTTSPRLTTLVPELPETIDEWFARACARDPAERFQTVRAATDGFVRALAGEAALPDSGPGSADDLSGNPASSVTGISFLPVPASPPSAPSTPRLASTTTSLSSTLSSPRSKERRTMMWLAGLVAVAALVATYALLTANGSERSPAASAADPSPAISAMPTASTASVTAATTTALSPSPSALAVSAPSVTAPSASTIAIAISPPAAPPLPGPPLATAIRPALPLAVPLPPSSASAAASGSAATAAAPPPAATPMATPAAPAPTATPSPEETPSPPAAPLDLRELTPPTTNGP